MSEILAQYGLFVVFGVILLPVYAMIAGWFIGEPRDTTVPMVALGYLVGFSVLIVVGLGLLAVVTAQIIPT